MRSGVCKLPSDQNEETKGACRPLAKMAVRPKDLAQVVKGLDPKGPDLVDHKPHLIAHPIEHSPGVELYRHNVLDNPEAVPAAGKKVLGSSNYSRKVIYRVGGVKLGKKPTWQSRKPLHRPLPP